MERFKQRARKLRNLQTSAEARLWRGLRNRGLARWKFRRQHPIDRYVVDFVTLDGKLIVEVDGVTHGSQRETLRDAQRTSSWTHLIPSHSCDECRYIRKPGRRVGDDLSRAMSRLTSERPSPDSRCARIRPLPGGER
ncbi:MAG: DUF559 domain-containing protein [Xanthobacteraceae bacterium]